MLYWHALHEGATSSSSGKSPLHVERFGIGSQVHLLYGSLPGGNFNRQKTGQKMVRLYDAALVLENH